MRPLRLSLEGFRSYRERAEFDFVDRDLVGVVGPTGSGKSSILDALAYALYGRTPAVGNAVRKLVNGRSDSAAVEFWFSVDSETFRVARRLGKTAAQSLERWDGVDGTKLETITDKASEIGSWVTESTGLGFDTFTRSVLLAQNQFMAMLTATPAEGAKVLTGLFGFAAIERMRKRTGELLADVKAELLAAKTAEAMHLQQVEALRVAEEQVADAAGRVGALDAIAGDLDSVHEQLTEAEERRTSASERQAALADAVSSLPDDTAFERVLAGAVDHEQLLTAAKAAEAEAATALERASAAMDEAVAEDLPGAIGTLELALAAAGTSRAGAVAAATALEAANDAATQARAALAAATQREADAQATKAEARDAAVAAERALAEAESVHAAHVLSEGLEAGDPCPVCSRVLDHAPDTEAPGDLEAVREVARLAGERAESAGTSLQAEATARAVAETKVTQAAAAAAEQASVAAAAERAAAEAEAAVADAVAGLGATGDGADVLAAAKQRWKALGDTKARASADHDRAAGARQALEATDALAEYDRLVAAHLSLGGLLGTEFDPPVEPSAAERALLPVRRLLAEQAGEADAALGEAMAAVATATDAASSLLSGVGLDSLDAYRTAVATGKEHLAGARAKAGLLAEQVESGAAALERAEAASAKALALEALHAHLAPGQFPQFLLDEKRRELTATGSEWLRGLSRGRYEFVLEDKQFRIRELSAAGLVRDADTLSGGETFLASLALALGLATMVGMEGGSLDAFFIDEGFGSLDAESLDLAMDGIEQLVTGEDGRLVVVVSHVPELRERIEDLIVLGKDEVTGETVVVRA